MSGLRETTAETMVAAHKAGMAYWERNPSARRLARDNLVILARSCGWHGDDEIAWLTGFYGAKRRYNSARLFRR